MLPLLLSLAVVAGPPAPARPSGSPAPPTPLPAVWGDPAAPGAVAAVHRGRLFVCFDLRRGPPCMQPVDGLPPLADGAWRLGFLSPRTLVVTPAHAGGEPGHAVHPGPTVTALEASSDLDAFAGSIPRRRTCGPTGVAVVARGGRVDLAPCHAAGRRCHGLSVPERRVLGLRIRLYAEGGTGQARARSRSRGRPGTTTTRELFFAGGLQVAFDPRRLRHHARAIRRARAALRRCQEVA